MFRQIDTDSLLFRGAPAFYVSPVVHGGIQSIAPDGLNIFFLAIIGNINYCWLFSRLSLEGFRREEAGQNEDTACRS